MLPDNNRPDSGLVMLAPESAPRASTADCARVLQESGAKVTRPRTAALYALIALLLAVPCVWQPHIQADDLSSHLYNAWLVNEVDAGRLKGLYVAPQFTNVLFDHILSSLLKSTGNVVVTERTTVILAVQIFFWGCFTLASTVAGRRAWSVIPFLVLLTYGAVFRMGFFNFYIGVGISLFAIALVWQERPRLSLLAIPLLLLTYTAHSLPCLWAAGVIGYVLLARRVRPERRIWLLAASILLILGSAAVMARTIPSRWVRGIPIASLLGSDQLLTYGMKYKVLAAGLFCLWILLLIRRFESGRPLMSDLGFQLWVLSLSICLFMPDAVGLPIYSGALTYITIRLSLLSAIFLCATIAALDLNRAERAASIALAIVFFSWSYVDERAINRIEQRISAATAALPVGTRLVSNLKDSRLFVPALAHVLDRVCIGRCFSYANYEPASAHFRLRAEPGNQYLLSNIDDVIALEHGQYIWDRHSIELLKLTVCNSSSGFCTSRVRDGERLLTTEIQSVPRWWTSNSGHGEIVSGN